MLSTVAWKMGRAGRRLWRARQRTGVRGLTVEAGKLARDIAKMAPPLAAGYVFDMRRGIRTRGFVRNEEQLAGVSIGGDPHYYEPIGLTPLRRAVELLPLEPAATTFVDLGAGRGRAVIVAAEMGFGRVLGVELDDELVVQAGENIRRWRARTRVVTPARQQVTVVQGDAASYPLPDGPLVVSLFNPFGPNTLRLVLRHLCQARAASAHTVYVVYLNPEFDRTLSEFPRFVPHARSRDWAVYRLDGVPALDRSTDGAVPAS